MRLDRAAVLVAGCALALGGCGGGDDEPQTSSANALYREWSYPKGGMDAARGVVITLHGGSWKLTGKNAALLMTPVVDALTREGYAVLNGTYQPGREGIEGVEALYELANERAGGRGVCAYGRSAGGSWALELAIRHEELRCVVAEAPPTDLAALGRISPAGRRLLTGIFGPDLAAHSPIRGPFSPETRILMAGATNDRTVPIEQARSFKRRWPEQTELAVLEPGSDRWVHSYVNRGSLDRYARGRDRFLRAALGRAP